MKHKTLISCLAVLTLCASSVSAEIRNARTGATYPKISDAVADPNTLAGDTITVDSGTYTGSAGWAAISKDNLTIQGLGDTKPILDADGAAITKKGVFYVTATNFTVENIEFRNAWASSTDTNDGAAGIYYAPSVISPSATLTVRNCCFRGNQNGVLTLNGAASIDILIESSEFDQNGEPNSADALLYGKTHNISIGAIRNFTLQNCWSHNAIAGSELRSRAKVNCILNNYISSDGTGGQEVCIANGGTAYIIGNVIVQGSNSRNAEIITYGGPGVPNSNPYLYIVNNTIINQRADGNPPYLTKNNSTANGIAVMQNNILAGGGNEVLLAGTGAGPLTQVTNWQITDFTNFSTQTINPAYFVNAAACDFRLTATATGAIDAGTDPGTGFNGYSLTPAYQYVHPYSRLNRSVNGTIDIGAYEYCVAAPNAAPTVNAGDDQTITLPTSSVTLSGSASDDGQPSPPASLTYTWSQVSGPTTVSFANANAADTTASGLTVAGVYVLRLTANDSVLAGDDTLTITVNPKPNTIPTVDAEPHVVAVYENMPVSLHAAASDPDDDSLTYAWSQTAGQAIVGPSGAATADYSFTAPVLADRSGGTMTFRVDVNDGHGGGDDDSVTVQVYMTGDGNHDWFVNVGDLQGLVAVWGSSAGGPADFNDDGFVNVGDLQALVANWGRTL